MERQYRPASDDFVYEIPAGWIDNGENASQAAGREFQEESGYTATSVTPLGSFYPLAGFLQETAFALFVTFDSSNLSLHQREQSEEIEISLVTEEELRAMIRRNEIQCMGSLAALNLYWNQLERK